MSEADVTFIVVTGIYLLAALSLIYIRWRQKAPYALLLTVEDKGTGCVGRIKITSTLSVQERHAALEAAYDLLHQQTVKLKSDMVALNGADEWHPPWERDDKIKTLAERFRQIFREGYDDEGLSVFIPLQLLAECLEITAKVVKEEPRTPLRDYLAVILARLDKMGMGDLA